jgi:hypothetical protein
LSGVHGGAYAPESVYPADPVKVVRGDPMAWILKRDPRFTCRGCGSRLFFGVLARRLPARRERVPSSARQVRACVSRAVPARDPADRRRPSSLQRHAEAFQRLGRNSWMATTAARQ